MHGHKHVGMAPLFICECMHECVRMYMYVWVRDFWALAVRAQAVSIKCWWKAGLIKKNRNLTEMEAGFTFGQDAMNYF